MCYQAHSFLEAPGQNLFSYPFQLVGLCIFLGPQPTFSIFRVSKLELNSLYAVLSLVLSFIALIYFY
jgi:hypothetical protein